jgi:hypothetical protein
MTTTNESARRRQGHARQQGRVRRPESSRQAGVGRFPPGRRSWLLSGTAASLFITATRPRDGRTAHGHVMPAVTGYGG